jgi:hypothetical protein
MLDTPIRPEFHTGLADPHVTDGSCAREQLDPLQVLVAGVEKLPLSC